MPADVLADHLVGVGIVQGLGEALLRERHLAAHVQERLSRIQGEAALDQRPRRGQRPCRQGCDQEQADRRDHDRRRQGQATFDQRRFRSHKLFIFKSCETLSHIVSFQ